MSEERDFVPGEIAILKLPLQTHCKGEQWELLPVGTELLISSHKRNSQDGHGYYFKHEAHPGMYCFVTHARLTRRREPPPPLSKHSFHELIQNLKDEKPLEIEAGEKV